MRLTLTNFGNHDQTELEFPDAGVVLVLGSNGAGKSILGEAICWVLWGGIIRAPQGTWSPVRGNTKVRIELGGAVYERVATDTSRSHFEIGGVKGRIREGTAQIVGSFGTLRTYQATHVFHHALLARFSHATDAERKDLMESLLGVAQFSEWFSSVRDEQREVVARRDELVQRQAHVRERVSFLLGKLDAEPPRASMTTMYTSYVNARDFIAEHPEQAGPPLNLDALRKDMSHWGSQGALARQCLSQAEGTLKRLRSLSGGKACPVCLRPVADDDPHMPRLIEVARATVEAADRDAALAAEKLEVVTGALAEAQRAENRFRSNQYKWECARAVVAAYEQSQSAYAASLQEYQDARRETHRELRTQRATLAEYEAGMQLLDTRVARLEDLARIYGPRGARLTLLLDTFSEVARVASIIASSIYQKSIYVGLDVDEDAQKVTLRIVLPSGVETPYRGLSEGERALIDFSLLKALASVQSNPNTGSSALPLIYDDVMDAVDAENRGRLAAYLREEAKRSLLLVISHDLTVRELFPTAKCLFVEEGKVRNE